MAYLVVVIVQEGNNKQFRVCLMSQNRVVVDTGGSRNKAMGGAVILEGRHILERALAPPPPSGAAEGIYDWGGFQRRG